MSPSNAKHTPVSPARIVEHLGLNHEIRKRRPCSIVKDPLERRHVAFSETFSERVVNEYAMVVAD